MRWPMLSYIVLLAVIIVLLIAFAATEKGLHFESAYPAPTFAWDDETSLLSAFVRWDDCDLEMTPQKDVVSE